MTIAAYCRVSSRHQKADSQIAEIEKWLDAHGYDPKQVPLVHGQGNGQDPETPRVRAATDGKSFRVAFDRHRLETRPPIPSPSGRHQRAGRLVRAWLEDRRHDATDRVERGGRANDRRLALGACGDRVGVPAERQAAGIEVAKKKGIYKGRQKGTTKGEPSRARQLRAKGLTVAEIAQALETNKRTVQRYLQAETVCGPQDR